MRPCDVKPRHHVMVSVTAVDSSGSRLPSVAGLRSTYEFVSYTNQLQAAVYTPAL